MVLLFNLISGIIIALITTIVSFESIKNQLSWKLRMMKPKIIIAIDAIISVNLILPIMLKRFICRENEMRRAVGFGMEIAMQLVHDYLRDMLEKIIVGYNYIMFKINKRKQKECVKRYPKLYWERNYLDTQEYTLQTNQYDARAIIKICKDYQIIFLHNDANGISEHKLCAVEIKTNKIISEFYKITDPAEEEHSFVIKEIKESNGNFFSTKSNNFYEFKNKNTLNKNENMLILSVGEEVETGGSWNYFQIQDFQTYRCLENMKILIFDISDIIHPKQIFMYEEKGEYKNNTMVRIGNKILFGKTQLQLLDLENFKIIKLCDISQLNEIQLIRENEEDITGQIELYTYSITQLGNNKFTINKNYNAQEGLVKISINIINIYNLNNCNIELINKLYIGRNYYCIYDNTLCVMNDMRNITIYKLNAQNEKYDITLPYELNNSHDSTNYIGMICDNNKLIIYNLKSNEKDAKLTYIDLNTNKIKQIKINDTEFIHVVIFNDYTLLVQEIEPRNLYQKIIKYLTMHTSYINAKITLVNNYIFCEENSISKKFKELIVPQTFYKVDTRNCVNKTDKNKIDFGNFYFDLRENVEKIAKILENCYLNKDVNGIIMDYAV